MRQGEKQDGLFYFYFFGARDDKFLFLTKHSERFIVIQGRVQTQRVFFSVSFLLNMQTFICIFRCLVV